MKPTATLSYEHESEKHETTVDIFSLDDYSLFFLMTFKPSLPSGKELRIKIRFFTDGDKVFEQELIQSQIKKMEENQYGFDVILTKTDGGIIYHMKKMHEEGLL